MHSSTLELDKKYPYQSFQGVSFQSIWMDLSFTHTRIEKRVKISSIDTLKWAKTENFNLEIDINFMKTINAIKVNTSKNVHFSAMNHIYFRIIWWVVF